MKKIRLVGKKLYRTGPLKLFNMPGGQERGGRSEGYTGPSLGSGGGSNRGYSGSTRRNLSRWGYGGSSRPTQYESQAVLEKREEDARRAAAKKKLELQKKANDLIDDNSPEGQDRRNRILKGPESEIQTQLNNQLGQIQKQKDDAAGDDIESSIKIKNWLKKFGKKLGKALINTATGGMMKMGDFVTDETMDPEEKKRKIEEMTPDFLKEEKIDRNSPEFKQRVQERIDSGEYDNPDNPNKFEGSPSQVQSVSKPKLKGHGGGSSGQMGNVSHRGPKVLPDGTVVPAGAAKPAAPAAPTPPSAMEQLQRTARGEDSIVEKESKLARDKALSSQLASIKGARGATAGQKLRALRRGQGDLNVVLGAQTAVEKAKERKAAQEKIIDLDEAEKSRQQAAGIGAYEKAKPGISAAAPSPGQSFGDKLQTGLDIYKKGKKIYKGAKDLFGFEEGGFVSGPGSETSDSIPARLSDGEFVVKASAVRGLGKQLGAKDKDEERQKGVDFLYKLQDKMDKAEKFKDGGEIKRFISMLSPEQRRKAAFDEKWEAGKKDKPKGAKFAWRPDQDKIDAIDKKYGLDLLEDEEIKKAFKKQNPRIEEMIKRERKIKKTGKFKDGGSVSASKLKDKLIGPLRVGMFGPGKMSDEERLEASDRKMKGKIRELKDEEINDNINKLMEELNKRNRKKLKVPKSKNEEKVKKLLEKQRIEGKEKDKLIDRLMGDRPKPRKSSWNKEPEDFLPMAKGGEAYVRPKKAFREAIGYEPESRFHDKAEKDAKFGGARRKFRHFKQGGEVSFGSVVSAKKRLNKNLEKLKRK